MSAPKPPHRTICSTDKDPVWHAQLAILAALILQLTLPDIFIPGPRILLPCLEGLLMLSLFFTTKKHVFTNTPLRKMNAVVLIILMGIANVYALQQLAHALLKGGSIQNGHGLIIAAMNIFLTNIIVFGLLYWEFDAGGPGKRTIDNVRNRDFSFPQMQNPEVAPIGWLPSFIDYLYVSLTNATAFSPTDTMPLTRIAKILMSIQSLTSLTAVALVVSRAVNILQ